MDWIYVKQVNGALDDATNTLFLPDSGIPVPADEMILEFGLKQVKIRLKPMPDSQKVGKQNKENDTRTLYATSSLLESACLITTQPYQMKIMANSICLGPVIGFLLGEQQYYYHHNFMQEYTDAMARAREVGGLVIAFKLSSIDWETETIYGLYFHVKKGRWEYGRCPLPAVLFRRAFNHEEGEIARLKHVVGKNFFNSMKLDKFEMYERIKEYPAFTRYLPETAKLTTDTFQRFLQKYQKIILKPVDLSRGRGICIVQKEGKALTVMDSIDDQIPIKIRLTENEAILYFQDKGFFSKKYIVQRYLSLSKINGSPWDIRIVMQKNEQLQWQCSGIECRLAGLDDYLTNISRGGRALTINQAIKLTQGPQTNAARLKRQLIRAATEFCIIMDDGDEHFGEFGLDFALDEDQNFWFIEANVRPTFNGFKKLDYKNYLHISSAPLLYATTLAGFTRRRRYE